MHVAASPEGREPGPIGEGFDRVLMAARSGGDRAWRDLYRATAPAVAGYLRARGVPDPEDIVGETFLRVVRTIGTFDGPEPAFRAWVFRIARNLAIDESRKRSRRREDPVPIEGPHAVGTDGAVGGTGDVEREALDAIERTHVLATLDLLTPDQRDVLLLRILGGFTIHEIAAILGRREGSVKMLQARGLAAIERKISRGAVTL
jgi:RNA polymerase sigma-70 factor, ECF subfamily